MHKEKQVFVLVFKHGSPEGCPVMFWRDYGAVAPNLWTTNGGIGYVAKLTAVCQARQGLDLALWHTLQQ